MSNNHSFDPVLGRVPSGIFILTAVSGGHSTGMLASWVMQAGFEPPCISVAVKQGRYVADWLTEECPFNLNLVGETGASLLSHFGKGFEPGAPAFEGLETEPCSRGVPILKSAIGHLECKSTRYVDSGDHRIFVADVIGGRLADEVTKPMVHIRKSGARY